MRVYVRARVCVHQCARMCSSVSAYVFARDMCSSVVCVHQCARMCSSVCARQYVLKLPQQCSTAKQKFTRKLNILSELINNDGDISRINACFDDLNTSWQLVEQKHDQYVDILDDKDLLESVEE